MKLAHYLQQLPVQLILAILSAIVGSHLLELPSICLLYTISSCFVELLLFLLPVMVFSFIFRALISMHKSSLYLILLIFAGVTLSNCTALLVAYGCGQLLLPSLGVSYSPDLAFGLNSEVSAMFKLNLPSIIGTETSMIAGTLLGVILSRLPFENSLRSLSEKCSLSLNNAVSLFLQRVFIPLLPLYVFSFCLKLSYDGALLLLFEQYGKVFLLIMSLVMAYISCLYLIAAKGNWRKALQNIRDMLPAATLGFSTMSSAATMPVTLACVEKTTKDKNFTSLIIPSTANIHMLGDDLQITITSMALLSAFGVPWPDLLSFLPFTLAFSLAKLSCVGIPGASVLVILPVLQSHLGFTPEMVSIMTTIYVLQDPFGTASNVMGNGAFALLVQRLFNRKQQLENLELGRE